MATTHPLLNVLDTTPSSVLPTRHRCVLLTLITMRDPTLAALAARVGCSRAVLCRMIKELDTAGWVVRTPTLRRDGGQGPTRYEVRLGGSAIVPIRTKTWPLAA